MATMASLERRAPHRKASSRSRQKRPHRPHRRRGPDESRDLRLQEGEVSHSIARPPDSGRKFLCRKRLATGNGGKFLLGFGLAADSSQEETYWCFRLRAPSKALQGPI